MLITIVNLVLAPAVELCIFSQSHCVIVSTIAFDQANGDENLIDYLAKFH